ncbi:hypothetical protein FE156_17140 [Streptomyces albidoflavus]|nr:hypothetical protein FE156_17140 [Streptomyces albidoflavus]
MRESHAFIGPGRTQQTGAPGSGKRGREGRHGRTLPASTDAAGVPTPPAHSHGVPPAAAIRWRATAAPATFPEAVRENEEVVPVNAGSTWVLSSGATVGR